jgi:hypothetical protein
LLRVRRTAAASCMLSETPGWRGWAAALLSAAHAKATPAARNGRPPPRLSLPWPVGQQNARPGGSRGPAAACRDAERKSRPRTTTRPRHAHFFRAVLLCRLPRVLRGATGAGAPPRARKKFARCIQFKDDDTYLKTTCSDNCQSLQGVGVRELYHLPTIAHAPQQAS